MPASTLPSVSSTLIIDGKTAQGEEDVQLEPSSNFANIGKTTTSSASSAASHCDFRAYIGPSCLKSMVLNSVREFEPTIADFNFGSFNDYQSILDEHLQYSY
ncbi:hypothetical protein QYM36_018816, partial [Artemia franciscana]